MIGRSLAVSFALEAIVFASIVVIAADMRAHFRVQDLGGVNVWGYRGPVLNQRQPREIRIALVGGDFAYGWGVAAAETLPYFVRRLVSLDVSHEEPPIGVTAVNLAARGMVIEEIPAWLDHFAYLQPDVICVLPDAASHATDAVRYLPDRSSRIFRAFGYSPILPLVVEEKATMRGSQGLGAVGALLEQLDSASRPQPPAPMADRSRAIAAAVDAALRAARAGVVLILPLDDPTPVSPGLANPRLRRVDLAAAPALRDPSLRLDGYYFSVAGHSRAADVVAPAVLDLLHAARESRR